MYPDRREVSTFLPWSLPEQPASGESAQDRIFFYSYRQIFC
jgi:hypothetical protein